MEAIGHHGVDCVWQAVGRPPAGWIGSLAGAQELELSPAAAQCSNTPATSAVCCA